MKATRSTTRWLLLCGLLCLGLPALSRASNTNYVSNRSPLFSTPFIPLPLGAVTANGWLLKQLELQRDGLTGHSEEIYTSGMSDLTSNNGWLGGAGDNWERAPYYVRGLVDLAYSLNDAGLKTKAQKWMDWTLTHQQGNGNIGPSGLDANDWWPRMPMLCALADYYDATGDSRVTNVLSKYFQYQNNNTPSDLGYWGDGRAMDNVSVVLWLYDRTGDASLLTLADKIRALAINWSSDFNNNVVSQTHAVNIAEAYKFPAVWYQRSLSTNDHMAYTNGHRNIMNGHGQPHQLPSGTEHLAGKSSIQGFEQCCAVERIWSDGISQMILGDAMIGDNLESIAFNALPATVSKTSRQQEYYTVPNQAQSSYGNKGYGTEYANGLVPSVLSGWPCCCFNWHMGWPKFTMYSWAASESNGLAVMAYAPTEVNAKVANGVNVKFVEDTQYPFEEQIRFTFTATQSVTFPLTLRMPSWCAAPSVHVNGSAQTGVTTGGYYTISRTWMSNDTVTVDLPMHIAVVGEINNSLAVTRGPLVYSLKIGESWNLRTANTVAGLDFGEYEITPTTSWNYALAIDPNNPGAAMTVHTNVMPANPFEQATTPVTITARARKISSWTMAANGLPNEVPSSPVNTAATEESVTLVPFGAENLRITYFPNYVYAGPAPTNWVAYNDCAWTVNSGSTPSGNDVTGMFTTNSPLGPSDTYLVNTNGSSLPVLVSFTTNATTGLVFLDRGFPIPVGSDVDTWFGGKIGTNNAVNWGSGSLGMTISGLDTGKLYNIVLWSTRGADNAAYSNRITDISISGADAYYNASSSDAERFGGDAGTRIRAALAPGRVARFDGVNPGSDGAVTFTLTASGDTLWPGGVATNGYLNAFAIMTSTNQASTNTPPPQTNPPVASAWTAYNDLGWQAGQTVANITTNSMFGLTTGSLRDYAAGTNLSVQVTLGTGTGSFPGNATNPPAGTDADVVFAGKVNCVGYANWSTGTMTLRFDNLTPGQRYSFALFGTRGDANYTYRWTDVQIVGATSFVNNSSAGSVILTNAMPADTARILAANMDGKLWRFDNILPAADGHIQFNATAGGSSSTGAYLNAFMLSTVGSSTNVDASGVPDAWKLQYFGSTNVNVNADSDNDGVSNFREYIAGCNPTSGGSLPMVNLTTDLGLTFDGVSQRVYSVDCKTNLFVPWIPFVTNIAGSNASQTIQLYATNHALFYRFRVRLGP